MTTNYPSGLDSFGAITTETMATPVGGRSHKAMHNDANAAIVAVQTELGTNPRGTAATVAARLDRVQAYRAVTSTDSVAVTDHVVHATSGTFTLTLPTAVGIAGREFVIRNSGTGTITLGRTSSQTIDGVAANLVIAGKGFVEVVSDGAGWQVLRGTYTDESVGRRLFTWDCVNGRWQMTYGDTGWRNVAADIETANGFTTVSTMLIRRVNNEIHLISAGILRAAAGAGNFYTFPTGFTVTSIYGRSYSNNPWYYSGAVAYLNMASTSDAGVSGVALTNSASAWPTSLPGTASGSIPA